MNKLPPYPIIAREGWPILTGLAVVALLFYWVIDWDFLGHVFLLLFLFSFQFFRDPVRELPLDERAVVSPVDGRVCKVERAQDPVTGEEALKISIFMNVFNVHSQKAPVSGTVETVRYTPGTFVNADLDKASTENERNDMQPNVLLYEPERALFVPDNDPLRFYRHIGRIGRKLLVPGGRMAFEINRAFAQETVALLLQQGYTEVSSTRDLSGNERFVTGRNPLA